MFYLIVFKFTILYWRFFLNIKKPLPALQDALMRRHNFNVHVFDTKWTFDYQRKPTKAQRFMISINNIVVIIIIIIIMIIVIGRGSNKAGSVKQANQQAT